MSRPSTARKVTRKTEEKRDAALDQGLALTIDGRAYTVRAGDLTGLDAAALRRECGYSFMGLMRAMETDPDIDLVAAFVWLARRVEGEKTLSYATVAGEIGYDVDIDLAQAADVEGDEDGDQGEG